MRTITRRQLHIAVAQAHHKYGLVVPDEVTNALATISRVGVGTRDKYQHCGCVYELAGLSWRHPRHETTLMLAQLTGTIDANICAAVDDSVGPGAELEVVDA